MNVMNSIFKPTIYIVPSLIVLSLSVLTGILHGAGLWQFPKQLYLPTVQKSAQAPNSHLKYVWYEPAGSFSACVQLCIKNGTCSCLCFSWILSRICCSASHHSLLSCLKKKPWRLMNPPGWKKKKDSAPGSQPTLHCPH